MVAAPRPQVASHAGPLLLPPPPASRPAANKGAASARQPGAAAVVPAAPAPQPQPAPASSAPADDLSLSGVLQRGASLDGLPEPPPHLLGPITNTLLRDPVRACDGVAYERATITAWFELGAGVFPGGRAPITSTELTPLPELAAEAAAWRAAAVAARQQQQRPEAATAAAQE